MKKIFFLVLLIAVGLFVSCAEPNIKEHEATSINYSYGFNKNVHVYEINGHQYIGRLKGSQTDWATHSGECPNPKHICPKCECETSKRDTVYLVFDGVETFEVSK